MRRFCTVTALLILCTTLRIFAHHSFAGTYDEQRRISVTGTVTEFKWTNPHGWLYVQVKDETGKITNWEFELGSTGGLTSRGWKKTDLKTGDHVSVQGFGAKDGSNVANAATVTLPDGRKLFGGFGETPGSPSNPR